MRYLLISLLLFTPPVHAEAIKNNALLEACENKGPAGQNFCYGFIVSAANGAQYYRNLVDTEGTFLDVCFPKDTSNRELVKTYVDWIKKYPSALDGAAYVGVSTALSTKYSCTKKKK